MRDGDSVNTCGINHTSNIPLEDLDSRSKPDCPKTFTGQITINMWKYKLGKQNNKCSNKC